MDHGRSATKALVGEKWFGPAHASIGWILANWWPHVTTHVMLGLEDVWSVITVDLVFHNSTIVAGVLLAIAFLRRACDLRPAAQRVASPADITNPSKSHAT